jgi:hypothetical protein
VDEGRFIPQWLMGLSSLWIAASSALKAEYRAIHRMGTSQREDKRMTKADFTAYRNPAGELVSDRAIHRGWECYDSDTRALQAQLQNGVVQ